MRQSNPTSRKKPEARRTRYPADAMVSLQSAFALDRRGREKQAIPLYERALSLGLTGRNLRDALICLASSLRTVGRPRDGIRYLLRARKRFPGDAAITLFLALCYHDLGETAHSLRMVSLLYLDKPPDPELVPYRAVLRRMFLAVRARRR